MTLPSDREQYPQVGFNGLVYGCAASGVVESLQAKSARPRVAFHAHRRKF